MGAGFQAFMQEDSDFVLYTGQGPGPGNSVWSSKTGKYQQSYTFLAVQSDGNVVIYQDGVVLWESHSNH